MLGKKITRKITGVYPYPRWDVASGPYRWVVGYSVTSHSGKPMGEWSHRVVSQDREGAILKTLAHWTRLDEKARKRWAKQEAKQENNQKEHNHDTTD